MKTANPTLRYISKPSITSAVPFSITQWSSIGWRTIPSPRSEIWKGEGKGAALLDTGGIQKNFRRNDGQARFLLCLRNAVLVRHSRRRVAGADTYGFWFWPADGNDQPISAEIKIMIWKVGTDNGKDDFWGNGQFQVGEKIIPDLKLLEKEQ